MITLLIKGCTAYANDLNIKAIVCLMESNEVNKIKRIFFIGIRGVRDFLKNSLPEMFHYILILPDFSLNCFTYIQSGMVHCFFSNDENVEDLVRKKTELINPYIRFIKNVSPSKNVYKLTSRK